MVVEEEGEGEVHHHLGGCQVVEGEEVEVEEVQQCFSSQMVAVVVEEEELHHSLGGSQLEEGVEVGVVEEVHQPSDDQMEGGEGGEGEGEEEHQEEALGLLDADQLVEDVEGKV